MTNTNISVDVVIPVYNNEKQLERQLENIFIWLNRWPSLDVFLVDDGSRDSVRSILKDVVHDRLTVLHHPENKGRSAALNTGWRRGVSTFVCFLDVDCSPQENWLDHFIKAVQQGKNSVFGNLKAEGNSYWSNYLNRIYERRASRYLKGSLDFSTPFCLFKRDLLISVGGFSEDYRKYGFEDRDLIHRIAKHPEFHPAFLSDVYAIHTPPGNFQSVQSKLFESGRSSAMLFSSRFPDAYKRSSYWSFDTRKHSILYNNILGAIFGFFSMNEKFFIKVINDERVPFNLWYLLVKVLSAKAFFDGTR